jgi:hypothetical protein
MIYIIFTCSLIDEHFNRREREYKISFENFVTYYKIKLPLEISNKIQPIIVENNLSNKYENPISFLDNYNFPVLYTNTNSIDTKNRGMKEIIDLHKCIDYFNIQDEDFIVKITGRYCLNITYSPFLQYLEEMIQKELKTECIIRYGSYKIAAVPHKASDCVTGAIGMTCKYVKQIHIPQEYECIEHLWAKTSILIHDSKVKILTKLGIYIAPGGHNFYLI